MHQQVVMESAQLVSTNPKVQLASPSHHCSLQCIRCLETAITVFNVRLASKTTNTVWWYQSSSSSNYEPRILKLEKPGSSEFTIFTEHLSYGYQGDAIHSFLEGGLWIATLGKTFLLLFEAVEDPTLEELSEQINLPTACRSRLH